MTQLAKAQTQQNELNFSDLVTQGPASKEVAYSIDTNNIPADDVSKLSSPELDPKKREQSQLKSLAQGVQDLSGYHYRQAAALVSSLSDTIVTSTLAPMTEALAGLKGGIEKIGDIFKDADTFSVTQELAQSAQGLIAEVKEHLATFAAEAGKFKGSPAQRAAEDAHSLSEILSELAKSPTIDPAQQKGKQPDFPLGSIDVTPPNLGGFGPIDAIADTFRSEQDFSRAWADALAAQRQEQFAKLVAGSKDAPLDIERPRRDLQDRSIVSHLEETNLELVASINYSRAALAAQDREYTSADERAKSIADKVRSLYDQYGTVSSQIQDQEAAIQHLEGVSAPEVDDAPAVKAQNEKKAGVFARVKAAAARLVRGSPDTEEGRDQPGTAAESNRNSEELSNLKNTLTELTAKKADIGEQFGIEKGNLQSAIAAQDSIEGVITQLQSRLSAAKEALQNALRQTCKDLHFIVPKDVANPVTEALLGVSIPVTTDPIPSIDRVLDKEYLQDLGAKVEEKDGGVSLTHQATGTSITIERRSSHGFDATLTVTDADGKQVASDRIWNDDLKKLVDHFLRTGDAPVRQKQVQSWKVVDEATAPEAGPSQQEVHAHFGVSARAARLVGFLKDALTAEGYDIAAPGSDESKRVVSNKLDISHSVNEIAKSVTAVLGKDNLRWSLFIEGAQQVALTTLDALAKVVGYFSHKPAAPEAEVESAGQPELAEAKVVSAEKSPSQPVTEAEQTPLEQLRDTLAQKYIGTKLRLSESGTKTSGTIMDLMVDPAPSDSPITGHLVKLKVKVSDSDTIDTWSFRADTERLAQLLEQESPTILTQVGKFRFRGKSPEQSAVEPSQGPTETVEQSRAAARNALAAEIYSAWRSSKINPSWEYALPGDALIHVRPNDDGFVTSLTIAGNRIGKRTGPDLEQSLRIIVGRYMQEREPKAAPGAISKFEHPEAQGHKPTTSYADFIRDAEATREKSIQAGQPHDPKLEKGPVHRR